MSVLGLSHPLNIQMRSDGERLYLLEMNTRMSGGLQLSCLAAGINIPDLAINELLGTPKQWNYPSVTSRKVVHIETPIFLE
jgi:biotin carboxylase